MAIARESGVDELRALAAFIEDGGDPVEIGQIEMWLGVAW